VDADLRGLACRDVVCRSGDLDVERDLAIRVLSGRVLGTVDRDVDDRRQWLLDRREVRLHVGLGPAAAELDDRDHASADNAGRTLVGRAEVGYGPRSGAGRASACWRG